MLPKHWPGAIAADSGAIGPERVRAPAEAPTTTAKWITDVTRPTLSVFRPAAHKNSGTAVVICPGGGYWNLAWDLEGEEVAARFSALGITGIVLKYRVPRRPDQPERLPAPGPLLDAQRAISRAADWGIDPNRVGIAGFSAGGHLALATATRFNQRTYEPSDAIDQWSYRPDFAIAVFCSVAEDTTMTWANQSREPMPGDRLGFCRSSLARHGSVPRWAERSGRGACR